MAPAGRAAHRDRAAAQRATVTCLLTAATAALQVLAYLDGTAAPITLDATVELRPPDLRPASAGGRRTPPAAAAPRREHSRGATSHSAGQAEAPPRGTGPGREQWAADRAHQLTETTRRRPCGAGAGEEDA